MGPVGMPEMIVIFLVALVLFGPKKLPELGKGMGEGIRGFKAAMQGKEESPVVVPPPTIPEEKA